MAMPRLFYVSFSTEGECIILVLSRKIQEKLRIGDEITLVVIRIDATSVRLGIEAPLHVNIIRDELGFSSDYKPTFEDGGPSVDDTGIWPSDGSESGNNNNKG